MSEIDTGVEKESISFESPQDLSTMKTMEIKFSLSGTNFKTQLPIFREGNAEEFLNFINEFNQAKTKLGYTNHLKLESGFEQLLLGNARNEWITIKNTILPQAQTVAAFNERIEAFKKLYISAPSAIDNQKNYLQRIKKNDKFTVPLFLDRLKHINMLLSQFPNGTIDDCFSNEEIKKIFYHSMPIRWRTNFINSGQSLAETDLDTLRTYMVQQEIQTDAHRKKTRELNKAKQQSGKSSNHGTNPKSRFFKRQASQKDNNGNKDKKRKLDNEDDCPIHGSSHKWGQCHQNQYGNNFKPRRTSTNGSSSNHSQARSQRSSFFNGLPNQVRINNNTSQNPSSESSDTRSQTSNSNSTRSFRYPSGYPNNDNGNNTNYYQGQYVVESYNQEKVGTQDYLPEGSILIKELNDKTVNLFGLCLFDSGSTTTLINKRSVPPAVVPSRGNSQAFTTTQGTYESREFL